MRWSVVMALFFQHLMSTNVLSIYTANESTGILDAMTSSKYRKFVPPPSGGNPVNVDLLVVFHELLPLTARYYRIGVDIIMHWMDPRLRFNSTNEEEKIPVGRNVEGLLWIPDLFMLDEKVGKDGFKPVQKTFVNKSGFVEYSRRLNLEMYCPMDYWWFPFDQQRCQITFQSFAYPIDKMRLRWPVDRYKDNKVADFDNFFHATEYMLLNHSISQTTTRVGDAGTYDVLMVTLELKRDASYYINQHLLPLNLNIILSMTTFWIDHKCVKARVTIPLVVVLTLTKQTSALKETFPFQKTPVSMEYYLNFSIIFVFMVLLEYCMIGIYKVKMIEKVEKGNKKSNESMLVIGGHNDIDPHPDNQFKRSFSSYLVNEPEEHNQEFIVHPIDTKSRYLYPLFFIFYNALYFSLLITNKGFAAF